MIERDVGKRIQEIRKKTGLTQEQLAERIGISPHYYSALERGIYNIKHELLVAILNELDCSADEIFCDVVKKSSITKATKLSAKLENLSLEEQYKIYEVVETLIKNAK